jgi:hypothetical protein
LTTVKFSQPVQGVGLFVASNGNIILRAYGRDGSLLDEVSHFDAMSHPAYPFIGAIEPSAQIASITIQGGGEGATGSIQIQSGARQPIGDFDWNGVPDLYWQEDGTNAPAAWYMGGADGSTILTSKVLRGPQPGWRIVGIADLDGDRHPDLIWQQDGTNMVNVWYMGGVDGNTVLNAKNLSGPQPGWRIVGTADLDNNGHPDLIWQEDGTNAPAAWYMGGADGSTVLSGKVLRGPQPGWRIVGTADLDNNGHPDLIWQQDDTNVVNVWYMAGADGNTILGAKTLFGQQIFHPGLRIVAVADLDGDRHPDFIWQQDGTNMPVVYYMAGTDGSTVLSVKALGGPQPGWRIVGPH